MKIIFFGTPAFAVPSLQRLLASSHQVAAVVTQPNRPRGRGQRVSESPVKQVALTHAIPTLQPARMKDPSFLDTLTALQPDLGIVAAYGKFLPEQLLALPRLGMINVHASLLPQYRGAAPIHRAVIAGETSTGITIIRLVREMDAGPMLRRAVHPIRPDDTSAVLDRSLAELGATILMQTIHDLEHNLNSEEAQDHSLATYAPRLTKDDGVIDWNRPAQAIHNQVRGLHPWPHAFTYLGGIRYVIHRTVPTDPLITLAGVKLVTAGRVLEASGDQLTVAASRGTALRILDIQPEGKRPQTARAFLAGHPIELGSVCSAHS